jgi:hypothetical protein
LKLATIGGKIVTASRLTSKDESAKELLRWLERTPDKGEVGSSSLSAPIYLKNNKLRHDHLPLVVPECGLSLIAKRVVLPVWEARMPRLVNKVPQLKRHSSGQARARYNGKCIYFRLYGTLEAEERYNAFCASLRQANPDDKPGAPPELTMAAVPLIGEVVLRYFEHAKNYYVRADKSPTGEHVTIQCSLRPLTRMFGSLPAREFSPLKLQRLQQEMIKLGWSRNYINKAIFIVLRCFKWAASQELFTKAVYNELESVESFARRHS